MPVTRRAQGRAGMAQVGAEPGAAKSSASPSRSIEVVPGTVFFSTRRASLSSESVSCGTDSRSLPLPLQQAPLPLHEAPLPLGFGGKAEDVGVRGTLVAYLSTGAWTGQCLMSLSCSGFQDPKIPHLPGESIQELV